MIVGIGIDAVEIDRVGRMFADKGERMLTRLFTGDELSYITAKMEPAQHLAVRLAAKEAAYKALSGNDLARGIGWRDVEVRTGGHGEPELCLSGAARAAAREPGLDRWAVSLMHDPTHAVAVVVATGTPRIETLP